MSENFDQDGFNFESLTGMQESSVMLHELYVSYVEGGFTEKEALQLLANLITNTAKTD